MFYSTLIVSALLSHIMFIDSAVGIADMNQAMNQLDDAMKAMENLPNVEKMKELEAQYPKHATPEQIAAAQQSFGEKYTPDEQMKMLQDNTWNDRFLAHIHEQCPAPKPGLPVWGIVLIIAGSAIVAAGIGFGVYKACKK